MLRAIAERLPTGAPAGDVEKIADAIIGHDPDRVIPLGTRRGQLTSLDVIRRGDGTIVPADGNEPRYTTRGLLLTEQAAINQALARLDNRLATVPESTIEAATRRRSLTGEQATMVRWLTSSGAGVEVVVGKAGTGKTYALHAARDAWSAAGIRSPGSRWLPGLPSSCATRPASRRPRSRGCSASSTTAARRRSRRGRCWSWIYADPGIMRTPSSVSWWESDW